MTVTIDFGLDWKYHERDGKRYRSRQNAGALQTEVWEVDSDNPSLGRWQATEAGTEPAADSE